MQDDEEIYMNQRRREDKCWTVKKWNKATPYIQIAGYIFLFIGVVFAAGGKWKGVEDAEGRVVALETWKSTAISDISAIRQAVVDTQHEVHDIHEWMRLGTR